MKISNQALVFNPKKILTFLNFLNNKFPKLEVFVLYFIETFCGMYYDDERMRKSPTKISNHMDYKTVLRTYRGDIKVEINHNIISDMVPSSQQAVKSYCRELGDLLPDFEYDFRTAKDSDCCSFRNSNKMGKNLVINKNIYLIFYNTNKNHSINGDLIKPPI